MRDTTDIAREAQQQMNGSRPAGVVVPVEVAQAVVNYLATRPYAEVVDLITALQRAEMEKPRDQQADPAV